MIDRSPPGDKVAIRMTAGIIKGPTSIELGAHRHDRIDRTQQTASQCGPAVTIPITDMKDWAGEIPTNIDIRTDHF